MERKKVALLANSLISPTGHSGGDWRMIKMITGVFYNMEKTLITPAAGKTKLAEVENILFDTIHCSTTPFIDKLGFVISYFYRIPTSILISLSIKSKQDFIYCPSDFLTDTIPATILKLKNRSAKYVVVVHHLTPKPSERSGNKIRNRVAYITQRISFRIIRKIADTVIVQSSLSKAQLISLGFNDYKISVVGNGIDPPPCLENIDGKKWDITFIGRLDNSKGVFDLVSLVKILKTKYPKIQIAVMGDTENENVKEKLLHEVAMARLTTNLIFLGFVSEKKKIEVLYSSCCFVSLSKEEGFGISILEAMSCGCPPIVWDLPIYSDLYLDGYVSAKCWDLNDFATKVCSLLDDPALRDRVASAAVKNAYKFSWENIISRERVAIMHSSQ